MIKKIKNNKKLYLDLLLLGDEQESMIDRYLNRGEMFALFDNNILKTVCVVTNEGNGICELKNIATYPQFQGQGCAKKLIKFIFKYYKNNYNTIRVGTSETPSTINFYKNCGFIESHRIQNFFIDNYNHLIFENGEQLIDMIYFSKELNK
ncbi:GNAT family N-acetyltransferase [Cetobacterium somerae]